MQISRRHTNFVDLAGLPFGRLRAVEPAPNRNGRLERRLEATMPSGYGWDDFMSGALHIDHIVPLAAFEYEAEDDPGFKAAWALSNLQLLPGAENMSKGSKLDWMRRTTAEQ